MIAILNKIRKRIKTREMIEGRVIEEIQITKQEAEQLGERKKIDNVKLIVVEKLGDMANKDCFAYIEKNGHRSCYCLDKLYCSNGKCEFYKKCNFSTDDNIPAIERSIKEYSYQKGGI